MEQRLIDANKLVRRLKAEKSYANPLDYDTRSIYEDCIGIVSAMETVDAEPVVRCQECVHLTKEGISAYAYGFCQKHDTCVYSEDFFCAYGMRCNACG